jgi:hypothetical protein
MGHPAMCIITRPRPIVNPVALDTPADEPATENAPTPYTAEDLEWAAVALNENATDYDVEHDYDVEPDYDSLAGEAEAQARYEAGLLF